MRIVDRQHPHDFWMELAASWERALSATTALSLYVAPSGEPALGPVAFIHRPSALDDPFAPLGHHWQDATHISFGVVTVGIFTPRWKLEGSAFNGREPDEERWGFDPIGLDSCSGRLTVNPTPAWSFAAGFGFLESPEALHPEESIYRATASVLRGGKLGETGQTSWALVWGANSHDGDWTPSVLVEGRAELDRANLFFGRAEAVQKTAGDLGSHPRPASTAINGSVWARCRSDTSRTPLAGAVFFRVRPFADPLMDMDMGGM